MTDEHQDHDQDDVDNGEERELPSAPTPDYGAPWLPITPQPERS
ncbi:hypothetical protein [Streptomyces sp. MBT97]|nr:hypothetical protein [Streptomyces sp. MBT97]